MENNILGVQAPSALTGYWLWQGLDLLRRQPELPFAIAEAIFAVRKWGAYPSL